MLTIHNIDNLMGQVCLAWRITNVQTIKHRDTNHYLISLKKHSSQPAYIHIDRDVKELYSKYVFVKLYYGLDEIDINTPTLEELSDRNKFLIGVIERFNQCIIFP